MGLNFCSMETGENNRKWLNFTLELTEIWTRYRILDLINIITVVQLCYRSGVLSEVWMSESGIVDDDDVGGDIYLRFMNFWTRGSYAWFR